jgi:hypothetical protein
MHEAEYTLTLSRPCGDRRAAFSIVLVGNQIADYALPMTANFAGLKGAESQVLALSQER